MKERPITEKASIFEQEDEARRKARLLLEQVKANKRATVKVEHLSGGRAINYETTPDRLDRLIKRLNKTGKTKIL